VRKEIARVFKDSTVYGLGSLLPRAAAIILIPIYTTYLTREDYGVMSFALTVSTMLGTVMILGQNGALSLFYRSTAERAEERRAMLFSVFVFVMLFGAVLLGLGFLIGPSTARRLTGSDQVPFYPYLALSLLIAFAGLPEALQQAVNRALGQAKLFTAFQLTAWAINTGFTLYFVVALHQGALGSLKGSLAAPLLIMPAAIFVLVKRWDMRFSFPALKRSLRFGLPLVPHYFAGWMLTFFDRYILMYLSTAAQVGLYSLAYNFGMIFSLFCSAINTAWAPIYYDLADTEDGRRKLPRLITVYCAAITVLAIGFTFFAPDLLLILANPRFHEAARIVPIISGGYFFFALYMIISAPIFHSRRTVIMPLISAGAAAVNVVVNFALIPRFGIVGAACATFAAYVCMAITARIMCSRLKRANFENAKLAALVVIYLLAMAAALVLVNLGLALWVDIAIKVALFPVFLGLLLVLRVTTLRDLMSFLKRRPPRPKKTATLEEEEAELERAAEESGHAPDDTGFNPDNQR